MIDGLRRSRIGWNPTEIEASKVGKTRKTPGFPGRRLEMVANLQSEMAELKAQNDGAKPAPPEDSKATPPDSADSADGADGPGTRGAWSIF